MTRAACGRADLIRALAVGGVHGLEDTAKLLGFSQQQETVPIGINIGLPPLDVRGGDFSSIEIQSLALIDVPFLRLESVDYLDNTEQQQSNSIASGEIELPAWTTEPKTQPSAKEIAPWRELLPRLRATVASPAATHALDIPKVVQRLSQGKTCTRLPRRKRRQWGAQLVVIEDRSDRLIPYWRDQSRVSALLEQLVPRHGFAHALYWEGLEKPIYTGQEDTFWDDGFPPAGSTVLVLGDLGYLACNDRTTRRYWTALGQQLADAGCRTVAISPISEQRSSQQEPQSWSVVCWERSLATHSVQQCEPGVEHLLTLLSPASRIEPGLLRDVRLSAGLEGAVESLFWQHPAMLSQSSVAGTLSAEAVQAQRSAFLAQDEAIRQKVLTHIHAWRAGLPPEVWFGEIQCLEKALRDDLPFREDAEHSDRYFAALGYRAAGVSGSSPPVGLSAWFRFLGPRLRPDHLGDTDLRDPFHQLWNAVLGDAVSIRAPNGYDPSRIQPGSTILRNIRNIRIDQVGGKLRFWVDDNSELSTTAGSPIATTTMLNGQISIEPLSVDSGSVRMQAQVIQLDDSVREGYCPIVRDSGLLIRTDREHLHFGRLTKPEWASAIGRDRFGLWAEFQIDNTQGEPIRQRMRWIAPGRFWMGSPEGELGRWGDEGPRHEVILSKGYWLFDTPCTQGLWEAVMGENPSGFKGADRPVETVSWDDAQGFIQEINRCITGLELVLPTEAQWEYGCRAGTETATYVGDLDTEEGESAILEPISMVWEK